MRVDTTHEYTLPPPRPEPQYDPTMDLIVRCFAALAASWCASAGRQQPTMQDVLAYAEDLEDYIRRGTL